MNDIPVAPNSFSRVESWPQEGLEWIGACPVCNCTTREVLYEGLRDQLFFCAPGVWTLYRCTGCDSGYLDPRPTPDTISLAYARYFTHSVYARPEIKELGIAKRLRRALANGYRNSRFGTHFVPSNPLGVLAARLLPLQRASLEAEARHLWKPEHGAKLLDVGCGNGDFLVIARDMGWESAGVEFDPMAAEVCRSRGLEVYEGGIETLSDRNEVFHAITLSHVIEHVHSPRDLLDSCFRLLKPGGSLWIQTPNLASAGHSRYGRFWKALDPPRHLVLFTWDSLQTMVTEADFEHISELRTGPWASNTFPASETIKRGKDPYKVTDGPLGVQFRAWRADRRALRAFRRHECITVSAKKPVRTSDTPAGTEGVQQGVEF